MRTPCVAVILGQADGSAEGCQWFTWKVVLEAVAGLSCAPTCIMPAVFLNHHFETRQAAPLVGGERAT